MLNANDIFVQGLAKRPDRDTLVERNILPDSTAAPGIGGQQEEREKSMRADQLEQALKHRPEKDELVKEGILKN